MMTVEDGHNTADDRELQTQQHLKLINLLEAEHILQIRESKWTRRTAQTWLVVRTWVLLTVVRTRKTDDDN